MAGHQGPTLTGEIDRVARQLGQRNFPEVARAIRASLPAMLLEWRTYTQKAVPELDKLTISEFENSVAALLGSIADLMECRDAERVRRFIEERQPWVTLHGHVHESARLSGSWRQAIGRTRCFSAAHDGPELAVVCFDPADPQRAGRRLV